MLNTVLEKLNKAKELINEAKNLASEHNIQLHYEVRNFGYSKDEMARIPKHWNSSTEQCSQDPDYINYW